MNASHKQDPRKRYLVDADFHHVVDKLIEWADSGIDLPAAATLAVQLRLERQARELINSLPALELPSAAEDA